MPSCRRLPHSRPSRRTRPVPAILPPSRAPPVSVGATHFTSGAQPGMAYSYGNAILEGGNAILIFNKITTSTKQRKSNRKVKKL